MRREKRDERYEEIVGGRSEKRTCFALKSTF